MMNLKSSLQFVQDEKYCKRLVLCTGMGIFIEEGLLTETLRDSASSSGVRDFWLTKIFCNLLAMKKQYQLVSSLNVSCFG